MISIEVLEKVSFQQKDSNNDLPSDVWLGPKQALKSV